MFVTVYVDVDTFHNLVLGNVDFDACLTPDRHASIQVSVPIHAVYTTNDNDIVTIQVRVI